MDAEVGEVDLSLNLVGKVETGKSNEFLINAPPQELMHSYRSF